MAEDLVSKIRFEMGQIERLFASYAELILRAQQTGAAPPTLVEMAALSSILHSFYNGLENIFLVTAKNLDQHLPVGEHWHRTLLTQMSQRTESRAAVISIELAERLDDYLGFRHFHRHSYSFFLEWERFSDLVTSLSDIWDKARKEISNFADALGQDEA